MATYNSHKVVVDYNSYYYTLPCLIGNTGISADSDGKKIIPAGTPVGNATKKALLDATAVLTVMNSSSTGANAQGVLAEDVDVTSGTATGTVAFAGVVDLTKCISTLTIDSTVNLPLILFSKRGRA